MKLRMLPTPASFIPVINTDALGNESDVEQKFVMPLLANSAFLGLPTTWIRTKEYMRPTDLDKSAGKTHGYVPDYSIWCRGLPLVIVEAKGPEIAVEFGLREARLYATEINKRFPPKINPIEFIIATNGVELILSHSDSENDALRFPIGDLGIGCNGLAALQSVLNSSELESAAEALAQKLSGRAFSRVASFMGGRNALNQQLGVNEFAEPLFPLLAKYFNADSDEVPEEVIDRAYVTTEEVGSYEGVLTSYLKDRTRRIAGNSVEQIETTKTNASGIGKEISKFVTNPSFFSRVQLIIGAVGAGKSTFIRRFYRHMLPREIRERLLWSSINFNVQRPEGQSLDEWICETFIESLVQTSKLDIYEADLQSKIFATELSRFDRGAGPAMLKKENPAQFALKRFELLEGLVGNPVEHTRAIARHFSGERRFGVVVIFDNVDKLSRDEQLSIFQAAQWFKDLTKSLVIINLRDSTFEANRDQPPLDAFANAINFYIRPPRFSLVIHRRMLLLLDQISGELDKRVTYTLPNGATVTYPSNRLGRFVFGMYLSMFSRRDRQITHIFEGIVAKDVRRAIGMFSDVITSPHIPASDLASASATEGQSEIKEFVLLKALMRGRYTYFSGKSGYIRNILNSDEHFIRPTNFLYVEVLDFLIRNRKERVDFTQEGYVLVSTLIKRMAQLGFDETDAERAIATLVEWGLVEPDSLLIEEVKTSDAVRVHASGFIHVRFLLPKLEYLVGITPDLALSSRELAERIGASWGGGRGHDIGIRAKSQIADELCTYFKLEYERRCRRFPFYQELGLGGRTLITACQNTTEFLSKLVPREPRLV